MTVHELWLALRRGWWMVLGVPLVAAIVVAVAPPYHSLTIQARMSLALDVPTELVVPTSDAGAAKVGETLVDDISRVIGGRVFAAAVAKRMGLSDGEEYSSPLPADIASSLSATDRHRVLDITVTRSDVDPPKAETKLEYERVTDVHLELTAIARAAGAELTENGDQWFALLGAGGARLSVVDWPVSDILPPTLRQRLETPLRLLAALALGVALALGRWILDQRIRSRADAATATGLPILGAIEGRRGR